MNRENIALFNATRRSLAKSLRAIIVDENSEKNSSCSVLDGTSYCVCFDGTFAVNSAGPKGGYNFSGTWCSGYRFSSARANRWADNIRDTRPEIADRISVRHWRDVRTAEKASLVGTLRGLAKALRKLGVG